MQEDSGFSRLQRGLDSYIEKHVSSSEDEDEEAEEEVEDKENEVESESSGSEDSDITPGDDLPKKGQFKMPGLPASKIIPAQLQGEIVRTREGVILPSRNAFEFVVRPESNIKEGFKKGSKAGQESGKALFMKNLLKLKRQNTSQLSANKNMSIVKFNN